MSEPHVVVPEWMTPAQVDAVNRLYDRQPSGTESRPAFFHRVKPILLGGGAVGIWIGAMFYGIEPDGHTHT